LMALGVGLLGARMVRMRICVPISVAWDFFLNTATDVLQRRASKKSPPIPKKVAKKREG